MELDGRPWLVPRKTPISKPACRAILAIQARPRCPVATRAGVDQSQLSRTVHSAARRPCPPVAVALEEDLASDLTGARCCCPPTVLMCGTPDLCRTGVFQHSRGSASRLVNDHLATPTDVPPLRRMQDWCTADPRVSLLARRRTTRQDPGASPPADGSTTSCTVAICRALTAQQTAVVLAAHPVCKHSEIRAGAATGVGDACAREQGQHSRRALAGLPLLTGTRAFVGALFVGTVGVHETPAMRRQAAVAAALAGTARNGRRASAATRKRKSWSTSTRQPHGTTSAYLLGPSPGGSDHDRLSSQVRARTFTAAFVKDRQCRRHPARLLSTAACASASGSQPDGCPDLVPAMDDDRHSRLAVGSVIARRLLVVLRA